MSRSYHERVLTCNIYHITMTNLPERLRNARKEAGLTQAQLAARCGLTTSAIGNIEAGVRKAPASMPKIAEALGVTLKWLSGEDDSRRDELSAHAKELAEMFDRIDQRDKVARALAYNAAMTAILDVIRQQQPASEPTRMQGLPSRTGSV